METTLLLKAFFAFAFVISLMLLFSWFLKKVGLSGQSLIPDAKRRLKIIEHLPLDHRRKLVLVRRDNCEHLLVLGPAGETVVEANIPPKEEKIVELVKEGKNVQNS